MTNLDLSMHFTKRFPNAVAIALLLVCSSHGQVPEYTPDQAMSRLDQAVRKTLGFPESGLLQTDPPQWLSLTYVGLAVAEDDARAVDLIAVTCPPADKTLGSFSSAHELDKVYRTILDFSTLARQQCVIPGLQAAREVLLDPKTKKHTPEYTAYREYYNKFEDVTELITDVTTDPDLSSTARDQKLRALNKKLVRVKRDWSVEGFKKKIEDALEKVMAHQAIAEEGNVEWRRELLSSWQLVADPAGVTTTGANMTIPRSFFHPAPSEWKEEAGWTGLTFSKSDTWSKDEEKHRKSHRYVSGSAGFLFAKARASGSRETENIDKHKISKASNLTFEFELKRAVIDRPWLDKRFLFEPRFWTWRRPTSVAPTEEIPRVSKGQDSDGAPVNNSKATYNDYKIPIPIVPVEAIVARNLTLKASVSVDDYKYIEEMTKSTFSGSGGFLFWSVGGGGSDYSKLTKGVKTGGKQEFSLTLAGPVVIGFISQVVPLAPDPGSGREWEANAWLESTP